MTPNPNTPNDPIAKMREEIEKDSGKMTSEVKQFFKEGIQNVQNKILANHPITTTDLSFTHEIQHWMGLSEWGRKQNPSIEAMKKTPEYAEGKKRGIGPGPWLGLLHLAKSKGVQDKKKWIDETFSFPGADQIVVEGDLNLSNLQELVRLPHGLMAKGELNLSHCPKLRELNDPLKVDGELILFDCPSLIRLPNELNVGKGLHIGKCPKLTRLPQELSVGGNLYLSKKSNPQVLRDAVRLKKENRIKGRVIESL